MCAAYPNLITLPPLFGHGGLAPLRLACTWEFRDERYNFLHEADYFPDIMWQYIITPRKENATAVTEIAGNLSQIALRTAVSKSFHVAINDRRVVDGVGICLQRAEVRELYTRLAKHQANQQLLEEHFALAMHQDGFGGLAPGPGGLVPVPSTPNVVVAFWDNMGSDAELRVPENFVEGL